MLGELTGKTALVTGAGMGIGRSIALVLARQGADVVLTDLNREWVLRVAEEIVTEKVQARQRPGALTKIDEVGKAGYALKAVRGHISLLRCPGGRWVVYRDCFTKEEKWVRGWKANEEEAKRFFEETCDAQAQAGFQRDGLMTLELDVTSQESVDRAVATVLQEWGHLDILVNNAGVASAPGGGPMSDREVDWDETFNINVKGVVRCCQAVVPHMKERRYGKIVNIASMAGHAPRRMGGAYAASKAAVLRYTKGLASELAPFNINVNAVCPGAVWTRFQQENIKRRQAQDPQLQQRDPYELFIQLYSPIFPLGRPQEAEDVGRAVAFLVSEDARQTTGQCLHVDGGAILRD